MMFSVFYWVTKATSYIFITLKLQLVLNCVLVVKLLLLLRHNADYTLFFCFCFVCLLGSLTNSGCFKFRITLEPEPEGVCIFANHIAVCNCCYTK